MRGEESERRRELAQQGGAEAKYGGTGSGEKKKNGVKRINERKSERGRMGGGGERACREDSRQ